MPVYAPWGLPNQSGAIMITGDAPGSHFSQAWGHIDNIYLQAPSSIGPSVVITTEQAAVMVPNEGWYLYDFLVQVTATGTGAITADLFNTSSAGSAAVNSYLNGPLTLTASLAAPAQFSARYMVSPVLDLRNDPVLSQNYWRQFAYPNLTNSAGQSPASGISFYRPMGGVLSLRVTTPSGGSITGLKAFARIGSLNKYPTGV